ncbi:MAG: hypothetical protein WC711_04080 [Candidatus Staskawiczbacteria bacterium]|jgi:hypothetical protein
MDLETIEKKLANNLEQSLKDGKYTTAKVDMDYYDEHVKAYGSKNIEKYCNLKNKFNSIKWCSAE